MKIKASPLEQHIFAPKLPKVSPNLIKKRPESSKEGQFMIRVGNVLNGM